MNDDMTPIDYIAEAAQSLLMAIGLVATAVLLDYMWGSL